MARFTLDIADELNTWLTEQAALNHRSKNGQIVHILELFKKDNDTPRHNLDTSYLCHNGVHNFASSSPATNDYCNCRMFVYGELAR